MKILILGVSGMLGHMVFNLLSKDERHSVVGAARSPFKKNVCSFISHQSQLVSIDVLNRDVLIDLFAKERPDWVINCVGLIKQQANAEDPLAALPINALLPHQLSKLCALIGARLLHISTDCVFSGKKGGYLESDPSDAYDLYGKSKYIGEIHDNSNVITLRTSIIGHELMSKLALLEWFLSQKERVYGYTQAIFSGLTTLELAKVIRDNILDNGALHGLYQVASKPIDKYSLLSLINEVYAKNIEIIPDDSLKIDRSLNADKFNAATGYSSPNWPDMIQEMHTCRSFSQEFLNV